MLPELDMPAPNEQYFVFISVFELKEQYSTENIEVLKMQFPEKEELLCAETSLQVINNSLKDEPLSI